MALDFNLVGPQDLPMRGTPFKPIDAVGNTAAVYDLKGRMVDLQEKQRMQEESAMNRQVMQEYLKGGGDFFTPPGIDKALVDLRGKISPDMYMKLGDGALRIKQADTQHQSMLSQLDERKLKAYGESFETVTPMLDQLSKAYESLKSEKGYVTAREQFYIGKQKLIEGLQGTPYGNPAILAALSKATPEQLPALISGSKWQAQQIKNRQEEAQTKSYEAAAAKSAAQAKFYGEGGASIGKPGVWIDSLGNKYAVTPGSAIVVKNGTEKMSIEDLPADVKALGAKGAGKPDDKVVIKPETLAFLANYAEANGGRSYPVPAFGIANSNARAAFLNTVAEMATEQGLTGKEKGQEAFFRRASVKALSNLTAQEAVIEVGMNDIERLLPAMRREVEKLGGPSSPIIRSIWNKVETEWLGDPKFVALNQQVVNFKDVASRVLSGQSGAGATPVAFLKLSDDLLSKSMSLEQIMAAETNIKELFDFRRKAVKQQIEALTRYQKDPHKNSEGAGKDSATPRARITSLSGGDRDLDPTMLAEVAASEYKNDITRAQADLADVNSELARKDLNGEARSIGERNKARISAVIAYMQKQAPKSAPAGPQTLKSGTRIREVK